MDVAELVKAAIAYLQANPLLALIAGAIILFAFYRRPGLSFFVLSIIVLLAAVYYIIMSMSSGAVSEKEHLLKKSAVPQEILQIDVSRILR